MLKQNEHPFDRLLRALLAVGFFVAGYYWLGSIAQAVSYLLGSAMLFTSVSGSCAIYSIFSLDTNKFFDKPRKSTVVIVASMIIAVLAAGSYASDFFSKKLFLEDFNAMNNYYKQALFNTGQEKRQESIDNYDELLASYSVFIDKYLNYQPVALRGDKQFEADLIKIDTLIKSVDQGVRNGDLKTMHTELEAIRPIWQEIFKRNGFSMLAVTLVDFHDSMEKVIDPANLGDIQGVLTAYVDTDQKLKAVEMEANDEEIISIRANLERLVEMAKNNASKEDLIKQAAILKASFVKVYLKRG